MSHKTMINPADLDVQVSESTLAGHVFDIISRFGDAEFTSLHIRKVVDTHPEYKRSRGQSGLDDAIRNKISRMTKQGVLERVGQYKNSQYVAYRKAKK